MPDATPAPLSDPLAEALVAHSPLDTGEALTALERAGRRGRLPGFARGQGQTFRLECDAVPFDYEMTGTVEAAREAGSSADGSAAAGTRVVLRIGRKPLLPIVFAATLVFTVWPGVWLTDSLIATYWSAYGRWSESMPWLTYAWYLPTCALPLPWVWKALVTKSASMARESARAQLAAVENELNPTPPT